VREPAVLLVDVDPALASLFGEWLNGCGLKAAHAATEDLRVELAVVDLPYPRQGGQQRLKEIRERFPGVPLVAVAPTCCSGVAASGAAARELGVDAVVDAPVRREALLAAVAEVRRKKA
jgi:CheY-like chemotaxis protein